MKKILYLLLLTPFCIDAIAQSKVPKPPRFNLNSYILIDANTNTVLAEFDADIQINPASMTKVMNGYVIADQIAKGAISLDDEVKISKKETKISLDKKIIREEHKLYPAAILKIFN